MYSSIIIPRAVRRRWIDFGVQVTRTFERSGEVFSTARPAGKVATALHIGSYERLGETHNTIHAWATANNVTFADTSWEIWGDWPTTRRNWKHEIEYPLR